MHRKRRREREHSRERLGGTGDDCGIESEQRSAQSGVGCRGISSPAVLPDRPVRAGRIIEPPPGAEATNLRRGHRPATLGPPGRSPDRTPSNGQQVSAYMHDIGIMSRIIASVTVALIVGRGRRDRLPFLGGEGTRT